VTEFHKPTNDTLLPILKMELTPAQTDAKLVAPNAITLAQAAYYERFGFKPTGRVIDGDEDELVYSVT